MIRPGTLDDVEGVTKLMNVVYPEIVQTLEGRRHSLVQALAKRQARWFAAVEEEQLIGWSGAGREVETSEPVAYVSVTVHPDARGRGLGRALADAAETHARSLESTRLSASSRDDESVRRFASARGWRNTGQQRFSSIDPRRVESPSPPDGVTLRPLAAFVDDPRPVYEVDMTASADMPLDYPFDNLSYEDWLTDYWEHPDVDLEFSAAAVLDGRPVALSVLRADRESGRAMNDITGTLPSHRGRGLATLVKREALRRAAETGITVVFTENDETNAPMLRVNEKLGYRPSATRLSWLKELG